jgi:type IV pilus assembly protein PilY1
MLHFFDASTGNEVGAFIPPGVRPNLQLMYESWKQFKATGLSQPHLYYIDASPKAAGVWVPSSPTDKTKSKDEWHTVLVCGLRKGGKTYFALGITNTENTWQGAYPPIGRGFLWEFPSTGKNYNYANVLAKMGQSWSDPAIGRIKIEGGDGELYERWVAFIGGGYDPTNTTGNAFFVVDIWTGELIKEFSGLTGGAGKTFSMPSPPKAVDVNGDGYVDKVYIGSLGNQMWVFDVSFNAITKKSVSQWSGKILFQAPGAPPNTHPIYSQAAVALDWSSNVWVFFGSGDREDPRGSTCNERFIAVKDDGKGSYPRGIGDLDNVTNDNTFSPPSDPPYKGWFIDLATTEKVLARASVFNGLVYFTTYTPKEVPDACTIAGTAKLYVVDYLSGGGALSVDELSDLQNPAGDRSKVIGEGIPSDPNISVNLQGQASVIIGTTSNQVYSQRAFSPAANKQFIYWHEIIP